MFKHVNSKPTALVINLRTLILRGGALFGLLVLIIVFSILSPYFLTLNNIFNILRQVSIILILASAQTMVIISAGIDLSVGALLALGGSLSAVAMCYWNWDFIPAIFLGLLVTTIVGLFNGVIITKGRIPDFIATLGMLGAVRGVALLITGGLPVPSHFTATTLRGYLPEFLIWLGSGELWSIPVPAIIAFIVVLITRFILINTTFGRSVYAVGGNKEAARGCGINIDRTKIFVYTITGLYCGIAGLVLTGRMNSANALMAEGIELQTIASVVIGGTNLFGGEGSIWGTLLGALLIGVIANGLNLLNVEVFWQRVINGLIIIGVVVFDQWRRRRLEAV